MKYSFPESFRFGVADADLQVIGEKYTQEFEGSEPTMWEHFGRNSGKCVDRQTPSEGVNRYGLWQQDIELMNSLGVKHYRTSVSMARVLTRNGDVNPKAITWYRNYFENLRSAGIRVYACLYHWELPQYLSERGGWTSRSVVEVMAQHARTVVAELGDLIDEYFLMNEPWCASFLSYHLGVHAPGHHSFAEGLLAAHHLLLAAGCMEEVIRSTQPSAQIDFCVNCSAFYAASNSAEDLQAQRYANAYLNGAFTDPIYTGEYPDALIEMAGDAMPEVAKADMQQICFGERLYALAINYYQGETVKHDPGSVLGYSSIKLEGGETTGLDWPIYLPPIYPEALFDVLHQLYHSFSRFGLKRLYVSENGMALETPWDGVSEVIEDPQRVKYLAGHTLQVAKAIQAGIPVEGYFAWTLLDNYEWAFGYAPYSCFGLVHVDRKSMRRVKKRSALWYQDLMGRHIIDYRAQDKPNNS